MAAKAAIAELECCEGCLQTAHTLCGYTAQFIHVEQVLLSQEFIRAAAAQSKSSDLPHPEHGSAISPNAEGLISGY